MFSEGRKFVNNNNYLSYIIRNSVNRVSTFHGWTYEYACIILWRTFNEIFKTKHCKLHTVKTSMANRIATPLSSENAFSICARCIVVVGWERQMHGMHWLNWWAKISEYLLAVWCVEWIVYAFVCCVLVYTYISMPIRRIHSSSIG